MGSPTSRVGDSCSHGAVLITGSETSVLNRRPVIRLGDLVRCPRPGHGVNPIIAIQTTVITDSRPTGHMSAIAHCGAVIIVGSDNSNSGSDK